MYPSYLTTKYKVAVTWVMVCVTEYANKASTQKLFIALTQSDLYRQTISVVAI